MKKNKNVIPSMDPERRLVIALNHVLQASRQVNAVSINNKTLTDRLEDAKKILLYVISTLQGEKRP